MGLTPTPPLGTGCAPGAALTETVDAKRATTADSAVYIIALEYSQWR